MRLSGIWPNLIVIAASLGAGCSSHAPQTVAAADCDNDELTAFDGLLIIAPHPDDEVLGFSGLASAFLQQGKPVRTVVVTDGDAYCEACALWTTGSVSGRTCDALTLSNLETTAIDSLAETRRAESQAAAAVLGRPAPEFLGYPDTGLGAAKSSVETGEPARLLRRSDFSACTSCGDCGSGYGAGPETKLSANTLIESLDGLLADASFNTLIATTHWKDGHADHAALGSFVSERAAAASGGRTVAFAVIHANTRNGHAYADCWYPNPAAEACPCFDEARADADPQWLASLRAHRENPDWAQLLPDDVDYGPASQLCLDSSTSSAKPRAIDAFKTQLGTAGREPGLLPKARTGMLDCSGYLRSFGRQTEVFVVRRLPD
jgi:LmbE family N-acetylglucosaminyl deacetylase